MYSIWYQIMLAVFLGAGTVYLATPKGRVASIYLCFNILAAIVLLLAMSSTPLDCVALQNAIAGANGTPGIFIY